MAGKFDPKCTYNLLKMADMHKLIDDIEKNKQLTAEEALLLKTEITGKAVKEGATFKRIGDMTAEYIVSGYLTSATNLTSNLYTGFTQTLITPLLREIEAVVGKVTAKPEDRRRSGEGIIMYKSLMQAFAEGLDVASNTWITGKPSGFKVNPASINLTAKELNDFGIKFGLEDARKELITEKMYDYDTEAIPGLLGKGIRLGAKAGITIDDFFQVIVKRVEFNAKAFRDADLLAERFGVSPEEAYAKATEQRMNSDNWDTVMKDTFGIKATQEIVNFANERVFRENLSPLAAGIQKWRNSHPLVGAIIIPFVKTMYNLIKEGRSYVPGVGVVVRKETIDPVLGRGTGNFDWALNIPVQRERLIAKQVMGFAATLYVNSLVEDGRITGSNPKGELPKYSVKIGDSWYSYSSLGPLATVFGLTADAHQIYNEYVKNSKENDVKARDKIAGELGWGMVQSFADNIASKTFLEGLAKITSVIIDPSKYAETFINTLPNAIVPAGVAAIARSFDENERQIVTFTDKLFSRIPELRETLPIRYDTMGQPLKGSLSDVLAGVKVFTPTELQKRLNAIDVDIKGIGKKVGGVELTAEQLSFYSQRSGGWFAAGLEKAMNSPQWEKYDEFQKETIVRNILSKSREAGAKETVGKYYNTDRQFANDFYNEMIIKKGAQGQYELKK
tara:strand:- start:1664 stop:3688 length:2025 start_codon:yes stop_codon:yes gene_type:complete